MNRATTGVPLAEVATIGRLWKIATAVATIGEAYDQPLAIPVHE